MPTQRFDACQPMFDGLVGFRRGRSVTVTVEGCYRSRSAALDDLVLICQVAPR